LSSAKLVARIVEKKNCTFTIAGAFFVGFVTTPWAITLVNWISGSHAGFPIPVIATMAAITVAYAFGEGLGRLACISFGCCYGKPLAASSDLIRRVFAGSGFILFGSTKKIAYAGGLEATEVIPIQAVTAVFYSVCGLMA